MLLTIDKLSRTPIYEQVVAQLEMHIQLGSFSQDQALPSVRSLSLELGVNPNTLQKAYAELERRGLRYPLPKNSKIFLGGGWKQFYREKVDKEAAAVSASDKTVKQQPVRKAKKVGPNDPCPCGSGKKYKKCCRDKDIAEGRV